LILEPLLEPPELLLDEDEDELPLLILPELLLELL
jgi:hypothetical protein|tara:strand:+ start:624 stop:728 length:105 start_codon:yes stop_codon:yes gene_type:complete